MNTYVQEKRKTLIYREWVAFMKARKELQEAGKSEAEIQVILEKTF